MPSAKPDIQTVVTMTMNTAIDRLIEVSDLRLGGHQRGRTLARVPAGKGVNVGRALAILGVPSIATGFVGRDEMAMYEESFSETLVHPQFLAITGRTRENLTLLDKVTHVETHVRDEGITPTPGDMVRLGNKMKVLTRAGGLVIIGGSTPPNVPPARAIEFVDLALKKGAHVAVDLPGQLLHALRDRHLWLVKPNREEFTAMVRAGEPKGAPADIKSGQITAELDEDEDDLLSDDELIDAGRVLAKNFRVLIVTCGADAGYLFTGSEVMIGQVHLDDERVRSTVGCGDALMGGFLAAQLRGKNIRESYHYGLAVATAAAVDMIPGHFAQIVVDEMLSETSVEPI
jgi:1-phosphofructokinase family hexose kinase